MLPGKKQLCTVLNPTQVGWYKIPRW